MESVFKYSFFAISWLLFAGTPTSCGETDAEKDKGATPVIKYARICEPDAADSLVTSATLGTRLCFIGDNLGDVRQVWFNDQKAKLDPAMVSSHSIIIEIPDDIPGEVTNSVRFITSTNNMTDYPFNVLVPAPRVSSINIENARPGDIVTINGDYFVDDPNVPLKVTFPGSIHAEIKRISRESIDVVVPECIDKGPVTVTSIYGDGESASRYPTTRVSAHLRI